jgi:FkbM family methyltransferase
MDVAKWRGLPNTFRFVWNHPLSRRKPFGALRRFVSWQLGSRLVPGPVAVDFVSPARLLVSHGMAGATGAVYVGLHEFEDMAFLLHTLRREDLFVDVGANVGSYTVLASAVVGARSLTFEPIPATFARLTQNVALNGIHGLVDTRNMGVGDSRGVLRFTTAFDTMNRVVRADEEGSTPTIDVPITTLDEALEGTSAPAFVKIDVEGFEMSVLQGAERSLGSGRVFAAIIEVLAEGDRRTSQDVHRVMSGYAYQAVTYDPLRRTLERLPELNPRGGNTIYVRDLGAAQARVASAPKFRVHGVEV